MATAQLIEGLDPSSVEPSAMAGTRLRAARLPLAIAGALLVVVLYAVFEHGGVALPAGTRVEVAIAVIAAVAALAWLGLDALSFTTSRPALAGLALLAGFAGWSGLTLLWSVAPDQTWIELNRAIAYLLVLALAISIGASHTRMPDLLARGFFAVALIVTVYALGQKLVPGLHVSGLFDLNQTGSIPRLQEPIGYWNALALFEVLAVPLGLRLVLEPSVSPRSRLAAASATVLMLVTIGLTLSRGGVLALVAALVVMVVGARERARSLVWIALVVLAALPPLVVGLAVHSLAASGAALSARETAGAVLTGVLIGSLAALCLAGRALLKHEDRLRLGTVGARWARRAGASALAVIVLGGVLAVIFTQAWHGFTSPRAPSNVSPNRLLTTDSYRWLWWKEAASAFADRPLGGWGAGSFGTVHLIYRRNTLPVQQPHSVPLQFLSETGVVGTLLGLGALALLVLAALRSARRRDLTGAERGVAMALLAATVAYLVHCLYDWDWNIPAVTLPALMFLGVLAGADRRPRDELLREAPVLGTRLLALAVVTLWLCFFALSAVLPSLAASKANAALIKASSAGQLSAARAGARLASRLDPLSDAGLRTEASIASHRGQLPRARYYLERAVEREPSDELAWNELATVDFFLRDRAGARQAAEKVLVLDPRGPDAHAIRTSRLLTGS